MVNMKGMNITPHFDCLIMFGTNISLYKVLNLQLGYFQLLYMFIYYTILHSYQDLQEKNYRFFEQNLKYFKSQNTV